ncbi:MAG TPA: bidirectional hydrogenase complex protein HoxU [Terriglobales bacterium]|nr:bidirectional hydrogenase complex protein HoxU [Terriglobales bacterium]
MAKKKVSIRIDGELISADEGQTILQAAKAEGKYIPTLCDLDGITPVGACRLCIVEVSGIDRLLPACTTPIQDGMSVTTNSPKLARYRRIAIELLLVERNHICSVCVSNGHCELQAMATSMGVATVRFAYNYPKLSLDASHPRFVLDHNRCILCTRCVRVCAELEGAHVWEMNSRGINARIVSELNSKWGDAHTCTNCGKCVQACPTGALSEKHKAVEEMVKRTDNLDQLVRRRKAVIA